MKKSRNKYIFGIAILSFVLSLCLSKSLNNIDTFYNSHTITHDVDVSSLSSKELEEDFEALISVLKYTGTNYMVDKRKYGEFLDKYKEEMLKKNKGKWDLKLLKKAISDINPRSTPHNKFIEPRDIENYAPRFLQTKDMPYKELFELMKSKNKAIMSVVNNKTTNSKYEGLAFYDNENPYKNDYITMKILEEGKIAYIKIPSFMIEEYKYSSALYEYFTDIEDYENLIIDVRGNGGGMVKPWMNIMSRLVKEDIAVDMYLGFRDTPLAKLLKEQTEQAIPMKYYEDMIAQTVETLPKTMTNINEEDIKALKYYVKITDIVTKTKKYDFNGEIYVLVDELSFSSSEMFAYYTKATGFATLVGNKSYGDGVAGIGRFAYPLANSGFIYEIQGTYGFNSDGSSNFESGTKPDIDVGNKDALAVTLDIIKKG